MITRSFTVTSQSINKQAYGAIDYANYLLDMEHPNHKERTEYKRIHRDPVELAMKAIKEASDIDLRNTKNNKGGRPLESYFQSYVFSPPKSIDLTDDQFKILAKRVLVEMADRLGLDKKTMADNCHISLHKQQNTHLNFLVNRNIEGESYQQILTRPSTSNLMRRTFNAVMLEFGYKYEDYKPENPKLSQFAVLEQREEELKQGLEELKKLKQIQRKAENQFSKLLKAFEEKDQKNINRQSNRLNKTILEYGESEEDQKLINEIIDAVNGVEDSQNTRILKPESRSRYRP
jgi:hypothetical protein